MHCTYHRRTSPGPFYAAALMRSSLLIASLVCASCTPTKPPGPNIAPEPPIQQRVEAFGSGSRLFWEDASSDVSASMVVRYVDGTNIDGKPIDGQTPNVGETLGNGLVVFVGREHETVDDDRPESCGVFRYQFWSLGKGGLWSAVGSEAVTNKGGFAIPTHGPGELHAQENDRKIHLVWDNDATDPGNFTTLFRDGVQIFAGLGVEADDDVSELKAGRMLTWAARTCSLCGDCYSVDSTATLPVPLAVLRPELLTASVNADAGRSVWITWAAPPAGTGYSYVTLTRRFEGNATDLPDAPGDLALDPLIDLLPNTPDAGRSYVYSVHGCDDAGQCEGVGATTAFAPTTKQLLRAGGYVLYFRHGTANVCADVPNGVCTPDAGGTWNCPGNNWWKSCDATCGTATAQQLNPDASYDEATLVRAAFGDGGLPVGRVRTSEFCRAVQTAQLFGFDAGEAGFELTPVVYDEPNRCSRVRALINESPDAGSGVANTALVGHLDFSCEPVPADLGFSEAAIFKPHAERDGGALFIQRIAPSQWSSTP